MDRETLNLLIGLISGFLIAIVPTILNNLFQAKQRKEERLEQRREAKIQAKEKIIERDILEIMDSLIELSNLFAKAGKIYKTYNPTKDKEEYELLLVEINQRTNILDILINSFEELHLGFGSEFVILLDDYENVLKRTDIISEDVLVGKWLEFLLQSGKLQQLLREKLISIRDTD